jgi:exodeoxyribonuclease VII small subunit
MPARKNDTAAREPSFEAALERLETLVSQMEDGNLPLEELIERYEEGIKLVNYCSTKLSAAEQRIEMIARKSDGKLTLENFSETTAQPETGKPSDVSLF